MVTFRRTDFRWTRIAIAATIAAALFCTEPTPVRATEQLADAANEALAEHLDHLETLAGQCDEHGLSDEAAKTRALVPPKEPGKLFLPTLPSEVAGGFDAGAASDHQKAWHKRLQAIRNAYANKLLGIARGAHRQKNATLAIDLLTAALHADPDHETLRRMFGYQRYENRWCTPYEAEKLRAGMVDHERFGWIPKAYVERYEQGERFYRGRWMSVEHEASFRDLWEVNSEHYNVRSKHSLEQAVQMARRLEQLHAAWRYLFMRYMINENQIGAMFAGRSAQLRSPRYKVVCYRDRQEYLQSVATPGSPQFALTDGLYMPAQRCIYVFPPERADGWRTIWHEATHQLFQETNNIRNMPGQRHNYWIIEGIATYMESFRMRNGYHVLGGLDYDTRLQTAAVRLLHEEHYYYLPIAQLVPLGRDQFQNHVNVPMLYSEVSGLTHFLIHGQEGRYRDALIGYLAAVYSGRDTVHTFRGLAGVPYEQLDAEYREFIEEAVERRQETYSREMNRPSGPMRPGEFGHRPSGVSGPMM